MSATRTFAFPAVFLSSMALLLSGCGPNLLERVSSPWSWGCCGTIVVVLDVLALIELAGSDRSTSNKVLWALLIIFFPVLGCVLYYFFSGR